MVVDVAALYNNITVAVGFVEMGVEESNVLSILVWGPRRGISIGFWKISGASRAWRAWRPWRRWYLSRIY